jgi:hypothetical protein
LNQGAIAVKNRTTESPIYELFVMPDVGVKTILTGIFFVKFSRILDGNCMNLNSVHGGGRSGGTGKSTKNVLTKNLRNIYSTDMA